MRKHCDFILLHKKYAWNSMHTVFIWVIQAKPSAWKWGKGLIKIAIFAIYEANFFNFDFMQVYAFMQFTKSPNNTILWWH